MSNLVAFRGSGLCFSLAAILILSAYIWDVEFVDYVVSYLEGFEQLELDEILMALVLIAAGVIWDLLANRKQQQFESNLQKEQLRILKSTMFTVMDTVNTFIVSIQLFRYEVEETGRISPIQQKQLDKAMDVTLDQLKRLQNMEAISEIELDENVFAIDIYNTELNSEKATA